MDERQSAEELFLEAEQNENDPEISARNDQTDDEGRFKALFRRYGLRFFMVLSALLLIWKLISDGSQQEQFRKDHAAQHERLSEAATTEIQHSLMLTGTILQAQVRESMLAGYFYRIRRIFRTLSKDRYVKQVVLMRNDGKILVSTSPGQEGSSYSNMFRNSTAALKDVYVDLSSEEVIHVLCPIYRGDDRLGLVILQYDRTHLSVFD